MVNKLPEKLHILRKHFGFSQQELADKMGVNVVEYMGWENGRAICNLAQFKRLANIFQISLDDMLKNSVDIQLPNLSLEDSIQIPFMKSDDVEMDTTIREQQPQSSIRTEETAQIKRVSDVQTKAQPKPINTIHRVDLNQKPVKKSKGKNNKLLMIIGTVIGVVVLGISLNFILNLSRGNNGLKLKMNQQNRLAIAEKMTVYVREDQKAAIYGQGIQLSDFEELVQVSAKYDFVVGLKSDGTLVTAGSNSYGQLDTKDFINVVDVAAGKKHTVAALKDGKVACVGDNSTGACGVTEWTNIVDVEAGDGFTLGIDANGNVKVAGTVANSSMMEQTKNVASISIGNYEVAFVNKSQTVTTVAITGTATNVATFKNVTQVAVGNGFVAALGTDGKVQVIGNDEEIKKVAATWLNMATIGANNTTLVGFNTAGKMVGAGDNQNNQYVNEVEPATKDALAKVTNVQFVLDKTKLKITWDKVEGADYYEVSINTNPVYTAKSVENNLSIDLSKLVDAQKYTVSIIASSNADKELNSEMFMVEYTYTAAIPDPTPTPTFSLTIKYQYEDGSTIYQEFTQSYNVGDTYSVTSPTIDGYKANRTLVEDTMGDKSVEVVVRYTKNATPVPTPIPTPAPTPVAPSIDEAGCTAIEGTFDVTTGICTPKAS